MSANSSAFRRAGSFKDRDYLETPERLVFCVIGDVHPEGRAIAYLKYVLEREKRAFRILRFYSVPYVEETLRFLEERYPQYVFRDECSGLMFSGVPHQHVKIHYRPEEALQRILREAKDPLEEKAASFASVLAEASGVSIRRFGITGSIMLGIHNLTYSDIDLIVYGREESLKVREALLNLYGKPETGVEKFKGEKLEAWCREKSRLHPISFEDAAEIYRRTWNRGIYRGTAFSVHPVKADYEVQEVYGSKRLKPLGIIEAEAIVADASESIFLPAVYQVEKVQLLKGETPGDIKEIVCFEGLYGGIFVEGEKVQVKGLLEQVETFQGEVYLRIIVGSRAAHGQDYMLPAH